MREILIGVLQEEKPKAPLSREDCNPAISCSIFFFLNGFRITVDKCLCCIVLVLERSRTPVQQCLHDLISNSEIGPLIEDAQQEGYGEAAVLRYLHDFVHMVHKPTVLEGEVEV